LLRDAAFESGVRYGRAARGEEWKKVFETHAIEFEGIYRFGELTQPGGEMPPVLEVTRSPNGSRMATKIEDKKMLLSAESIHILTPSRFVATPPSWRNYVYQGLLIQVTPNDLPDRALRPKNAAEQKIWEDAVREGWEAGRKLANQTVAANLARLDRDYFGQLAYVEVLARGMIEPARVGTDRAVVVGNRAGMSIDQTTVNLESDAGLVPDARRWNKQ